MCNTSSCRKRNVFPFRLNRIHNDAIIRRIRVKYSTQQACNPLQIRHSPLYHTFAIAGTFAVAGKVSGVGIQIIEVVFVGEIVPEDYVAILAEILAIAMLRCMIWRDREQPLKFVKHANEEKFDSEMMSIFFVVVVVLVEKRGAALRQNIRRVFPCFRRMQSSCLIPRDGLSRAPPCCGYYITERFSCAIPLLVHLIHPPMHYARHRGSSSRRTLGIEMFPRHRNRPSASKGPRKFRRQCFCCIQQKRVAEKTHAWIPAEDVEAEN